MNWIYRSTVRCSVSFSPNRQSPPVASSRIEWQVTAGSAMLPPAMPRRATSSTWHRCSSQARLLSCGKRRGCPLAKLNEDQSAKLERSRALQSQKVFGKLTLNVLPLRRKRSSGALDRFCQFFRTPLFTESAAWLDMGDLGHQTSRTPR